MAEEAVRSPWGMHISTGRRSEEGENNRVLRKVGIRCSDLGTARSGTGSERIVSADRESCRGQRSHVPRNEVVMRAAIASCVQEFVQEGRDHRGVWGQNRYRICQNAARIYRSGSGLRTHRARQVEIVSGRDRCVAIPDVISITYGIAITGLRCRPGGTQQQYRSRKSMRYAKRFWSVIFSISVK